MHKLLKALLVGALVALVVAPAAAQDDLGNVIIGSTFGSTGVNFNPITSSTATEQDIMNLLYPGLVGVNPETAIIEPNAPGGLAKSWEVSEDGTVYTITLKDYFQWSDGTPVTANDIAISWAAITSGQVETPLAYLTSYITDVRVIDDYTLEVTIPEPSCESVGNFYFQAFPSHLVMDADGNVDWQAVNTMTMSSPEDLEVGPYALSAQIPDQQTALVPVAEGQWPAEQEGPILNDGYIQKVVGDQTVQIEQFLAGEIDFLTFVPPDRRADIRSAEGISSYEFSPGDTWDYFAVNHANPENPQPARDENGNLIEQDPHPLFAVREVRQALAHAINMDDVITAAVFGEGSKMQSMYAPGTWVYNDEVPFYEYDPDRARELLAEAGWTDEDGDGVIECHGCAHAEEGTPFSFTLYTNQGNTRREAFGQIIQDQLAEVGIEVDFQTIDFNVLVDMLDQQTFDAVILGWRNSYPFSPDYTQIFGTSGDVIGGSNSVSYVSEEMDELMRRALTLPGCDPQERAEIYGQAAQLFHEDLPYIVQFSTNGMYAWQDTLQGVDPYPANLLWNLTEWTRTE
ncbi:MAG: ABC transporter substrate-binding protein [Chloroflexota bacterium]